MTKTLSVQIREAAEEMDQVEFYNYLIDLQNQGVLEYLNYDSVEWCRDFALRLVEQMKSNLESGEWFGYEIRALMALENDCTCTEEELVKINTYGYPVDIKDNEDLMYILGVEDQLRAIEE